jgi:hypothetical protein
MPRRLLGRSSTLSTIALSLFLPEKRDKLEEVPKPAAAS